MTTTDTTLLIILTSLLSLFFVLCIVVMIVVLKLVVTLRRTVAMAENVVTSVEAAADVFKDASGKMAMFKLIKNVVDLVQRKKK